MIVSAPNREETEEDSLTFISSNSEHMSSISSLFICIRFGYFTANECNVTKIGFEPQKLNIYGEQQATLVLTTKETKKF
jgi:hypothetical protein